jgi:glycosyltransferase 2 family protein
MILAQFKIKQLVVESWRIYMISGFYGLLLPGIIGGDAIRVVMCSGKLGIKKSTIAVTVLFERTCGFLMVLLMGVFAALTVPTLLYDEQRGHLSFTIYFLAIALIIIFFLFFVVIRLCGVGWIISLQKRGRKWHDLGLLLRAFRRFSMRTLIAIMLLSSFAYCLDIFGSFFLAKALHIDQPVQVFFLIMPLVYLMTMLPISLGGLGVREGVLAYFLVKVGILASDAVLLGFMIYLNRLAVALLGGFIQFKSSGWFNLKGYLAR